MIDFVSPFLFLGAFQLLRQMVQDIREREIDYTTIQFMNGIVIYIYLLSGRWIEGILILLIATFGLNLIKDQAWIKKNIIGLEDGDILTLVWVLSGLWFFGIIPIALFIGLYTLGLYFMHKKKVVQIPVLVPITIAFILTWTFLVITKAVTG